VQDLGIGGIMVLVRLVTCTLALLAVGVASAAGWAGPHVALDAVSPVVVVGSGFEQRAPVRVAVTASGRTLAKTVRSNATGGFRASWQTSLAAKRCTLVSISATSANRHAASRSMSSKHCGAIGVPIEPIDPAPGK
jgi:hypothetical protein